MFWLHFMAFVHFLGEGVCVCISSSDPLSSLVTVVTTGSRAGPWKCTWLWTPSMWCQWVKQTVRKRWVWAAEAGMACQHLQGSCAGQTVCIHSQQCLILGVKARSQRTWAHTRPVYLPPPPLILFLCEHLCLIHSKQKIIWILGIKNDVFMVVYNIGQKEQIRNTLEGSGRKKAWCLTPQLYTFLE